MDKFRVVIIAVLVGLLAGCGTPAVSRSIDIHEKAGDEAAEVERPVESEKPAETPVVEDAGDETGENQTEPLEPAVDETGPKPQESAVTEKLDTDILNQLDNTKLSWNYRPNSEHKAPGIPANAGKLIETHDGVYLGDTSQKVVYLTFDEGYENGYTPMILDALKENDTKAIFFVTGPYLKKNSGLVKRMLDEGHQVGNHSVNHPSLPSVDNATLEKELLGLEKELMSKFNKGFRYMRPPMGEYSERTLAAAKQLGYKTVFWSFAYRDWEVDKQKGAEYAYNKVMNGLHNGAVILLHAVSKDNAEALDRIIKGIKAEGYEIKPLDL